MKSNLARDYPLVSSEWNYRNNYSLPENYASQSNKKVSWICKNCKHTWEARIYSRSKGVGCPACAGKVVSSSNNLVTKFPEIAKEWHPTKNGKLTASQVISFCDLRYATGKSYEVNGFKKVNTSQGWCWTDGKQRFNRLTCKAGNGKTEAENAKDLNWFKIYDAGQAKYIKIIGEIV